MSHRCRCVVLRCVTLSMVDRSPPTILRTGDLRASGLQTVYYIRAVTPEPGNKGDDRPSEPKGLLGPGSFVVVVGGDFGGGGRAGGRCRNNRCTPHPMILLI